MKLAGFFKIIPIAGVMMVIAGVVGLLLFGVQKCSADLGAYTLCPNCSHALNDLDEKIPRLTGYFGE